MSFCQSVPQLFSGKAQSKVFMHQAWVESVRRQAGFPDWCNGWLICVTER